MKDLLLGGSTTCRRESLEPLKPVATSFVSCSRAEVAECPARNPCWSKAGSRCVLTVVSMRASITFAAGQSSEIYRYEVPIEESLPGLGIGMTIDDFQIAEIRHDVTESLKSAVRYSIALGPRFFRLKILSLSGPKALVLLQFLIPVVIVVCHDQVRLQVSQGFHCRDS